MICLILCVISCGPVMNSSTADAERYGTSATGTEAFKAAQKVVVNKCASCHVAWASYSEADYVNSNRVFRRSLLDSVLYTKIKGNESGIPGNMPPGEPLTNDEIFAFKFWILTM